MNPRANLASRLAFGLSGLGAFGWVGAVQAQTPPAPAPAAASPYQDRLIEGGSLAPDISSGSSAGADNGGLARAVQIDAVASVMSSSSAGSSNNVNENGFLAKSQWDTASYGAWSLDASARTGGSNDGPYDGGQGGVIALRQRGMPFDDGWLANNGLGDLNAPNIGLARTQQRFYLPTGYMQGLTTEWRGPSDLQIVAGGGVPGQYDGIVVPDFRTLGGSTATAGAEWSPAAHWIVGGQIIEARDVSLEASSALVSLPPLNSTTGLLSAAWAERDEHLQMNLIDGSISGQSNGLGGWIDGSIQRGRISQNAGLFRIDPNITWGNQQISSDAEGGYYRIGYQGPRWTADGGIDEVRSVSGLGPDTTFLTGDARYQLSRDWGVGTAANLGHSGNGDGNSWSLEQYVDHVNLWGTARLQTQYAESPTAHDATLTVAQNWSSTHGLHASTAAALERISGSLYDASIPAATPYAPDQQSTVLGLAAAGGGSISARMSIEGTVHWARAVQGEAAPGTTANVSLTYQLAQHWEILGTFYENQVGSWTPLTVQSPLTPPTAAVVPSFNERGIFVTLRYKHSQGAHFAPLGGAPGGGSGEVSGIVYLDANDNGRYEAGEAGAPNVTVVLDGRFSVQTDSAGRFTIPAVASGHHVITVVPDNLPLPWILVNDGRTPIEVSTRERTDIAIPARRPR